VRAGVGRLGVELPHESRRAHGRAAGRRGRGALCAQPQLPAAGAGPHLSSGTAPGPCRESSAVVRACHWTSRYVVKSARGGERTQLQPGQATVVRQTGRSSNCLSPVQPRPAHMAWCGQSQVHAARHLDGLRCGSVRPPSAPPPLRSRRKGASACVAARPHCRPAASPCAAGAQDARPAMHDERHTIPSSSMCCAVAGGAAARGRRPPPPRAHRARRRPAARTRGRARRRAGARRPPARLARQARPLVTALPALPQAACLRRCPGAGAVMRAACAASGMLGACRQTAPSVTAWRQSGPRAERPAAAGQARDGHPALRAQVDERGCGGGTRRQRRQRGRPQPLRRLRPLRRVPHEARVTLNRPGAAPPLASGGDCHTPLHRGGLPLVQGNGKRCNATGAV